MITRAPSTLPRMLPITLVQSTYKEGIIGYERVDENEFVLVKIYIDENGSDMLTKILSMEKLIVCQLKTGLVDSPIHE